MRQKDTTGAPVRSDPKVGNAWAWRPSSNAATDSSSAAVTAPWPPRPWIRTANIAASFPHEARWLRGLPQGRWTRVVGPSPLVRTALTRCG